MNTPTTPFKRSCQDLGLCQWRDPACDTCPNKASPLTHHDTTTTERVDDAPTWWQVFQSWLPSRDAAWGAALFVALFATYAWTQNADDAAATAELARAQQLGYQKGYNKGSSEGLKAAHKTCHQRTTLTQHCDWLLANAVVAYSDEVQP